MERQLSIAQIIDKVGKLKTKSEKVVYLKKHNSLTLRDILALTYSKGVLEFDLPDTPPPYTPSDSRESQGMLYHESRKLVYFVKNRPEGANLSKPRKEVVFTQLLETIDPDDAKVLCQMIAQTHFKGVTKEMLIEAFEDTPNWLPASI